MLWNSIDVAEALGLSVQGKWVAGGISIDTRTLQKGDIFVAIKGENFDGVNFVKEALAKGAVAAISAKAPSGVDKNKVIVVEDALAALQKLAEHRRKNTKAQLVAVTGSVGKTSVKEAIRAVLAAQGKTFATTGNLNNHIGLPLSLSRLPLDAEYGVFELGMNHAGELSHLTAIIRPHVAVITTVEAVHLEFFDSVEGIAHAKSEIMEGVQPSGAVVINRDNSYFPIMKKKAATLGIKDVRTFGKHKDASYRLKDMSITKQGLQVGAEIDGEKVEYALKTFGSHHAINSVIVLAVAKAVGANLKKAMKTLGSITSEKGRGRLHQLTIAGKKFTLIDDSYNASPTSMRAGLEVLSTLKKLSGGRAIAVLGDMRELGAAAEKLHVELAKDVVEKKIDGVYAAGLMMGKMFAKLPKTKQVRHAAEPLALLGVLERDIKSGDIILVKGSNGTGTWKLVDALLVDAGVGKHIKGGH